MNESDNLVRIQMFDDMVKIVDMLEKENERLVDQVVHQQRVLAMFFCEAVSHGAEPGPLLERAEKLAQLCYTEGETRQ